MQSMSAGPPPIPGHPSSETASTPAKASGRRYDIGAIAVGVAVDTVCTMLLTYSAVMVLSFRLAFAGGTRSPFAIQEVLRQRMSSTSWLLSFGALGLTFTVLGGYVTSRIARSRPARHGALMGIASGTLGTLISLLTGSVAPLWFRIVAWLAALPAGALGGWFGRGHAAVARQGGAP